MEKERLRERVDIGLINEFKSEAFIVIFISQPFGS